jgi:hypothetical protein
MIEYGEFFSEQIIEECTIEELRAIIKGLVLRLDQDQMLHNESLIDKRWYRKTLEEKTKSFEYSLDYYKNRIKKLEIEIDVNKKIVDAYRKKYYGPAKKGKTVN